MSQPTKILSPIRLKDFNPDFHDGLDKDETREKSLKLCQRIGELQELLHANASQALLIVLQGMDTSGKDGTVKQVQRNFPTPDELFQTIDSMPMRRLEMRERQTKI